jgi:hypothetical protein
MSDKKYTQEDWDRYGPPNGLHRALNELVDLRAENERLRTIMAKARDSYGSVAHILDDIEASLSPTPEQQEKTSCAECGGRGEVLERNEPHASDDVVPCDECQPEQQEKGE